jgi:hypothetical protein
MFSLFQSRHPLGFLFLIPITALLGFAHYWFAPENIVINFELWHKNPDFERFHIGIAYIFMLSVNAIALNTLFNRLNLIDYFSHVVGLFYALITFASVNLNDFQVLIADFFVILGSVFLLQMKNNSDAKSIVFNSTFFYSLSLTFNQDYIALLILPFVALSRTRSFILREYLMVPLGFLVVSAYIFFYHFLYELEFEIMKSSSTTLTWSSTSKLSVIVLTSLLVFLAFITRSRATGSPGIRIERIVRLVFTAFGIQFFAVLLFALMRLDNHQHLAIFAAFYTAYAYNFTKFKWLYHFLSYGLLTLGILHHLELF